MKYIIQMKKKVLWLNKPKRRDLQLCQELSGLSYTPKYSLIISVIIKFFLFILFSGIAELSLLLHTCTNSNANV